MRGKCVQRQAWPEKAAQGARKMAPICGTPESTCRERHAEQRRNWQYVHSLVSLTCSVNAGTIVLRRDIVKY
jgi:hypothetical protein